MVRRHFIYTPTNQDRSCTLSWSRETLCLLIFCLPALRLPRAHAGCHHHDCIQDNRCNHHHRNKNALHDVILKFVDHSSMPFRYSIVEKSPSNAALRRLLMINPSCRSAEKLPLVADTSEGPGKDFRGTTPPPASNIWCICLGDTKSCA
ncbi:hypothetical protein NEOLEDRAFT_630637 [Neolentinus lepideus HHB14362 ss-1]|uniref:Uncharacterized protein n=1 Tax=Neolentinus lepideus HHB14362 ss-1 TaxID=1314782 RepID=A0A165QR19_9AGAM|nr:hypothetical protein NEOLEDRAFT_630637 [Neolentinus lepideus HHB14362 ss-1]